MVVMKRGDVVQVAGGLYTSKPRPVLLIQDPVLKTGESLVVIPFTSARNDEVSFRVKVEPTRKNGLDRGCYLEIDKISAIKKSAIGNRLGSLEAPWLQEAEQLLASLLSLAQ
jgi:mRNA interferase MazF